jgi:GxxExxY protein
MGEPLYKEESYKIIGLCMEVYNVLGRGYSEAVYKDALEYEFERTGIAFTREREYRIQYKDTVLPHKYFADFVVGDKILLEVKAVECLVDGHIKQVLNYLATSKLRLGLLVNFGESSLASKRVVL